jgi:xanthine dehydrogenase accessory factor
MSDPILDALLESIEAKEPVALVTVIAADGNLALALGRRQLVWLDREPLGALGLGALEAQVLDDAQETLSAGRSRTFDYRSEAGSASVFIEVQQRPPTLLIVGAGHIAVPLAKLGKMLGFRVVVADDRPAFANRARFPDADEIIVDYFRPALRSFPVDHNTYIVLVTRGHQHDVECLLEVLDSPAAYIGMIGSRRRVRAVFQLLSEEQGIPAEKFQRVHSPIGLDIGAETPEEIALAIAAEIVKVRRGGTGLSLSDELRPSRTVRSGQATRKDRPA